MSTPTKAAAAEAAAQVADGFDRQIRAELAAGVSAGRSVPKLLGLIANDDKGAAMYARWTGRACQRNGVEFELRKVERVNLEDAVIAANDDASVHGIIVYYPVFGGAIDDYIRDVISASKDVEGLNHRYRYALYHNIRYLDDGGLPDYLDERAAGAAPRRKKCIVPCTPLACIKILEHLGAYDESHPVGERLIGKTALVYNRSEVVGRPLAAMLANDGALVYSVDITGILVYRRGRVKGTLKVEETSVTPEKALTEADIVISGARRRDCAEISGGSSRSLISALQACPRRASRWTRRASRRAPSRSISRARRCIG